MERVFLIGGLVLCAFQITAMELSKGKQPVQTLSYALILCESLIAAAEVSDEKYEHLLWNTWKRYAITQNNNVPNECGTKEASQQLLEMKKELAVISRTKSVTPPPTPELLLLSTDENVTNS